MNMDLCVIEYPAQGGTRYTVEEGKTLLNSVHGVFLMNGFVNGVPGLNVYGNDKIRDGYIQIDRQNIKSGGLDLTKYFGSRVQAYTRYDDVIDEYSLIAIDIDEKAEAFEVDFRDIDYINSYEIGYIDENGDEKVYSIPNLRHIVENGEQLESITDMCDYSENEGSIRFAASENAKEIDTAIIYKYNYYVVNNVDTRLFRIVPRYNRTHNGLSYIQVDDKAAMDVYIDGVESDYTSLTPGSVIKVLQCLSTGYLRIDAMSQGVLSGAPETIYDNTVVVEGTEYRLAKDWEVFVQKKKGDTSIISSQRPKELELGVNTTFYVIDGIIAAYTSSQSSQYGFIKSASQSRTSIDPDITLRMFTQEGEWVDYIISDKIEFEGQPNVSKDAVLAAFNDEERNEHFFDHPVRFRVSGENKLLAIDSIYESQYETDTADDIVFTQHAGMARDYTFEAVGMDIPFFMAESTIIFVCPDGSQDESEYKIITNTQMPTASGAILVPTKVYNLNDYCQISLMVVTKALNTSGGKEEWYYIEKITDAVIDADNQIYGKKISAKHFKGIDRGQGVLADVYFYADEKMMNKNEVGPEEDGYTEENIIEVGDFISATVVGNFVASWNTVLEGGIVPEPTPANDGISDKIKGKETYVAGGKFVRASAETKVWVANVDGVNTPVIPAVKAVIDPVDHKIIEADVSDFSEGDNIYYRWENGRGKFFIKNSDL
jgi:hypothetical protein